MKYKLLIISICFSLAAAAQNVGIGTNTPAAKLDITSTSSGILIPRIALTGTNDATTVPLAVTSMMIYNTATVAGANAVTPGFYYWTGTLWMRVIDNGSQTNIYNSDGTLTGARTVTMGADNLSFSSTTGHVITTADASVNGATVGRGGGNVSSNTAVGNGALRANGVGGFNNTAVGVNALTSNSNGFGNAAVGTGALTYNNANANSAFGFSALGATTTGYQNTATGYAALTGNTTGINNTASGCAALAATTTGSYNTAIGEGALNIDTFGSYNTAGGCLALYQNGSGSNNTAYGNNAGYLNTSGSFNTFLGTKSTSSTGSLTNATAIGANAYVAQDNALILGSIDGVNGATASTLVGIGTSAPSGVLHVMSASYPNAIIDGSNSFGTWLEIASENPGGQIFSLISTGSTSTEGVGKLVLDKCSSYGVTSGNIMTWVYSTGAVGIGTSAPAHSLEVIGEVKADTLMMTAGAAAGYILQSDATGKGSWVNPSTFIGTIYNSDGTLTGARTVTMGADNLTFSSTTGHVITTADASVNGATVGRGGGNVSSNTAVGNGALRVNTATGTNNTAVGVNALTSNFNGFGNAAFGAMALNYNNANGNSAFGFSALGATTTGYQNTATGYAALTGNTTGINNTASGCAALAATTTGSYNTATGEGALNIDTFGSYNTAGGYLALYQNGSGSDNTAYGNNAGYLNTSGSFNTFLGTKSTSSTGSLTNATAIGTDAYVTQSNSMVLGSINGVNSATASTSVGIGTSAPSHRLEVIGEVKADTFLMTTGAAAGYFLQSDATGKASWVPLSNSLTNIYNSDGALNASRTVTMGSDNLTFSSTTGQVITTADAIINGVSVGLGGGSYANNVVIGQNAMPTNVGAGFYNVVVGDNALAANNNGTANVAVGYSALPANTSGSYNAAVGEQALNGNTTGQGNTAMGNGALISTSSGGDNTSIGSYAGAGNTTGSGNTFLGASSNASSGTLSNATAVGVNAYVTQSNTLILGQINGVNSATASTKVGIGTTSPAYTLDVAGQIRSTQAGGGNASAIIASGTSSGTYAWDVTSGGTDQKWWDALAGSTAMAFRAVNDANSGATTWLQVNRGAGATISSVGFPAGNVAIGAGSTTFPLDVTNTVSASTSTMNHTDEVNGTSYGGFTYVATNGAGNLGYVGSDATYAMSIRSAGGIMAPTYFATSDRRIKNIEGTSCGDEDLRTLAGIQITDYTMRDRLANGNAHYKKVIAQQVKEVYPQAVNTSHAPQYIPNIYRCAVGVKISGNEISISMPEAIKADKDIAVGKKCKLFLSEKNKTGVEKEIKGEITAINGEKLTIKTEDAPGGDYDAAFVYGTEINDLLTVDYDAISMLNVSATQELNKKVEALEKENAEQRSTNSKLQSDIDKLKASVEALQQIVSSKAER